VQHVPVGGMHGRSPDSISLGYGSIGKGIHQGILESIQVSCTLEADEEKRQALP